MADSESVQPRILRRAASLVGVLLCAVPALDAPPAAASETIVSLEHGVDTLDTAAPDWRATTASLAWSDAEHSFRADWRQVERFGLDDGQAVAGGRIGLTPDAGVTVEVNAGSEHLVLPKFGASIDVDWRLSPSVVVHLGARQARYPEDTATAIVPGVEVYRGSWRTAYTLVDARLDDGESGTAHILQVDRYYGDGSRIGVIGATGGEATRIDADTVVVADVTSGALVGRHWWGPRFGVSYVYAWTEQGDFYTRQGFALGLLFRF